MNHHHTAFRRRGVSLLEAMLLMVIVSIVGVGFGIALQSSAHVPEVVDVRLAIHARLVEKMEDLASMDFATLSANSGLSDAVTISGTTYSRVVAVAPCDGDGSGSADADILEVTVTIADQSLATRVVQP